MRLWNVAITFTFTSGVCLCLQWMRTLQEGSAQHYWLVIYHCVLSSQDCFASAVNRVNLKAHSFEMLRFYARCQTQRFFLGCAWTSSLRSRSHVSVVGHSQQFVCTTPAFVCCSKCCCFFEQVFGYKCSQRHGKKHLKPEMFVHRKRAQIQLSKATTPRWPSATLRPGGPGPPPPPRATHKLQTTFNICLNRPEQQQKQHLRVCGVFTTRARVHSD